jgi:hypothetical protein
VEASIPCAAAPHVLWMPTVTYYSVPALIFLVTPVFSFESNELMIKYCFQVVSGMLYKVLYG